MTDILQIILVVQCKCTYHHVHTNVYIPTCTYQRVHTNVYIPTCTYQYVHTIMYIPSCTYHHVHTIVYIPSCTYHHVHTIMYIPMCTYHHAYTNMNTHLHIQSRFEYCGRGYVYCGKSQWSWLNKELWVREYSVLFRITVIFCSRAAAPSINTVQLTNRNRMLPSMGLDMRQYKSADHDANK